MTTVLTGQGIAMFQLLAMKGRYKLELHGLKGRGRTMYSLVKQQYGFKGSRKAVYDQFCKLIEEESKKLQSGDIQS